jgi:hypothetical protein
MRLTGQGMKRLIGLMNIAVGVVLCTIFGPCWSNDLGYPVEPLTCGWDWLLAWAGS